MQLTVRIAPLLALLVGCAQDARDLQPTVAPASLSATGIHELPVRPFAPQYPLWTDGATKRRFIYLPSPLGADWQPPVGTKLWKEFSFTGAVAETRFMERTEAGWIFATYDASGALVPDAGRRGEHDIPSKADCLACHGNAASPVLGFTALQLSDDRDPLAPHADPLRPGMLTLRTLVAEKRLSPPRPELARRPPRVAGADPVERAARGYLSANCGHCHNTRGPLARLGFSLLQEVGREGTGSGEASPIGAHTRFDVPGVPTDSTLAIAPGAPERSAVAYRMASRRPVSQMPPLGTVIADSQAVDLVRRWIASLGHEPSMAAAQSAHGSSRRPSSGR